MNRNRLLGIFIVTTILIWILVFALSPQQRYQQSIKINIPQFPDPSVDIENIQKIDLKEVKNSSLKIEIRDSISSAKKKVDEINLNLYVYKIGAFRSHKTTSNLVELFNKAGFPAFTQENKFNNKLINVFVGPFATKNDIQDNQENLNKIAGIEVGEVIAWNP